MFERNKCLLHPSGKQNSSSPIPALNELCAGPGSPARSLGFIYHTRAWEGGKKSNQTARGELLFLLGAGSPLSHCLSPQRSRPLEREAGICVGFGDRCCDKKHFSLKQAPAALHLLLDTFRLLWSPTQPQPDAPGKPLCLGDSSESQPGSRYSEIHGKIKHREEISQCFRAPERFSAGYRERVHSNP